MSSSKGVRRASHAGSWYDANPIQLKEELESNLSQVVPLPTLDYSPPCQDAKAIISPHAGYTYSGQAAAWAYASIPTDRYKKVFVIGPSHHQSFHGIALSPFKSYATPFGEILLCTDTIQALRETGEFTQMRSAGDEEEHSLEMQMPYLRLIFQGRDDLRLVPLIVSHPTAAQYESYASILAPYWNDPESFFVFSTDFCHWGSRFSYTNYYPQAPFPEDPVPPISSPGEKPAIPLTMRSTPGGGGQIWQSIQYMDHEGIAILRDPTSPTAVDDWNAYLNRTGNTICGRYGLSLFLHLVKKVYGSS
ncbi:hypothetical protein TREMEDRAFT_56524, partial [Tremella mesenterica DSM 1558]|uniref:uncharacterized protein n=1 Tax=Tremella mesenterica (strain ATCC 24925 / CBS 8224 / DSM 1558 / NBRC 9311 / NRRL Y-6157 / RJB 2259-6 / UBC 559-6) TaxID=578456 RepID=UPI0003F49862